MNLKMLLKVCALSAIASALAWGQAGGLNGQIEGTVTDPTGAEVPRAKVEITNDNTGYKRSSQTDADGFYRFTLLPLGAYTVSVEGSGFAPQKLHIANLGAGQTVPINVTLAVGATTDAVTVTDAAPVIETSRTDIGSTVSANLVQNLALVSRNPYNFILNQPNVSGSPNVEFGVPRKVNANGFVDRINYQIDGSNNTQSDRAGIRLTPFSQTYIAEVQQVNNGFAPEFGNTVGTVYNAITKSGGNQFHGEAAYIFRRTGMTARSTLLAPTALKPEQKVDDELVNVTGPIIKDKLFFFGAWEHVARDLPAPVTVSAANLTALKLPSTWINAVPFAQAVTFVLGKADYQISENHRLSARYSYFRNESPYNGGGGLTLQSQTYLFKDRAPAFAAQLISTFGPRLVNEFRFSIPQRYQRQLAADFTGAPPTINITGVANFGQSAATGVNFTETTPEFSDNLSFNRGTHGYKFGANIRMIRDKQVSATFARYTFPSLAAYLAAVDGTNTRGYTTYSQVFGNPEFTYSSLFSGFYVQDSWKIKPNITLNYGVRYDVYRVPEGRAGALVATSQNFQTDKNNFAPRVGLAWGLGKAQKTVVRVNGGIFYDAPQTNVYYNTYVASGAPQFFTANLTPSQAVAPSFPTVLTGIPAGFTLPTQDVTTVSPDFRSLYSANLNAQISREIGGNMAVTVGYLFTKGTHIPVVRNINLIPSGATLADGRPIYGTGRVDPRFNNILMAESVANSNYNGLNLSLNRRFSKGFEWAATYTWSHAIDDAPESNVLDSGSLVLSDTSNRRRDRGNGFADRRHAFNVSALLRPSFGSGKGISYLANHNQLSFSLVARSGDPFNITANRNLNGDAAASSANAQRPLYLGRNVVVGPSVVQLDARYSRIFPIRERWKPEFFIEAWDTLNHSNITGLNTSATVDATGAITAPPSFLATAALDNRLLQLGLRITF
jgi:hypothetical protein